MTISIDGALKVHVLTFIPDDNEPPLVIGVYGSEEGARAAIQREYSVGPPDGCFDVREWWVDDVEMPHRPTYPPWPKSMTERVAPRR